MEQARGWTLFFHPLLVGQLERLAAAAARERSTGRAKTREAPGPAEGPNTKLLAHLLDLIFEKIPADPGGTQFRHGGALRGGHRAWFRGKTGNGRYRLFYRFDSRSRVIVYAWVNDEESLRTKGAKRDACAVFADMLDDGDPPSDWDALLAKVSSTGKAMKQTVAELRERHRGSKAE